MIRITSLTRTLAATAAVAVSAGASAANPGDFVEPQIIDHEVAAFTGHPVGQPGGAIAPVDRRLRLARCGAPLALNWYGPPGRTVTVSCPERGGWEIFVNVRQQPKAEAPAIAVRRGETVTIAFQGRGFTVQQQGEARSDGAIGEWIEVRTDRRSPTLRARVIRPGLVVIENV